MDSSFDLDRLEADVQAARDQLARLEQERADLVLELDEFETLYNARIGPIQAKLEETQLHIGEYKLRIEMVRLRGRALAPSQLEAEVEYRLRDQRQHAEALHEQSQRARSTSPPPPIDPAAQLDLKQVYRELAKRAHPDLAADADDRQQRSQRMTEVNALYARRELDELRQLLRHFEAEQQRQREDPQQRQRRLTDEYDRIAAAIRHARSEIAELNHGSMMMLKLEYALVRARGRDVLDEVAQQTQTRLSKAETELNLLIGVFRELVEVSGLAN